MTINHKYSYLIFYFDKKFHFQKLAQMISMEFNCWVNLSITRWFIKMYITLIDKYSVIVSFSNKPEQIWW